ncbi:PTS system IIB component (Glc family) /PTS system IIC component (Glc family) [Streptomyces sp. Ag109_O5-1]|uniref:PTS transporter subunit EIIC n=1 Tax=Streptomyces sp. Ag109_O5-1 TaxID=1938851 RepID=UPI000F4E51F0|nr:PTS transporter subunit EIIC [Streptomyces sp. Ag109_O5-1]RPE42907.1 PTS system IIB component (Glc family) /PTS system IIC component (Glc family) [Streptomyces sp. Ag109_O5-1]
MQRSPYDTAAALLPLLGGPANITSVAHCMTRLRLGIADRSAVDEETVRAVPGVLGVVADGDTFQIVIGPGAVVAVTAEFEQMLSADPLPAPPVPTEPQSAEPLPVPPLPAEPQSAPPASAQPLSPDPLPVPPLSAERLAARGAELRADHARRNATPLKTALRRIADVFVPLIPALIGCGILAGLGGLLVNAGWLPWLTPALAAIASGFMALISVFVGYNTAKVFGGTPVLGGAVAAIVVYPGVAKVTAFGVALSPGQGGVLGALAAALLAVRVERWCRGRVPDALDVLLTPTVTVLVAGLATLYGLMYAAGLVSTAIGTAANWLLATTGPLAGLVLGGLFLPLVMLGLHQALIPIHTTLIQQQGYTVLLPLLAMAGAGQVGAALAVYARLRRDTSLRTTIKSALPAGLLGVGEPLIYGVSLPLGRPFLTACAGGAAGGAFVGFFAVLGDRVGATAIGPSGWALFPLLTGNRGPALAAAIYAGGLLTGYAVGFLATYLSFDGDSVGDGSSLRRST